MNRALATRIEKIRDEEQAEKLKLNRDPVKFAEQVRILRGEKFSLEGREYLKAIMRDDAKFILIRKGRQLEVSEMAQNMMYHFSSLNPNTVAQYVSDTQPHADKFSKLRFKKFGFEESAILQQLINTKNYAIREVTYNNGSITYFNSAWGDFAEVNSIPCDLLIVDEIHNTNVEVLESATDSLNHSKFGKFIGIGIGDFQDTAWDKLWKKGTQYYWNFETKTWEARNPGAKIHSYYISPHMAPWITPEDIAESYENAVSKVYWKIHYLGEIVEGLKKPITHAMMMKLTDKNLRLISTDIDSIRGDGPIFLGLDFGGGKRSHTVVWITQVLNEEIPITRLLYVAVIDDPNVETQADKIINLIEIFQPDLGVMDEGGGIRQMQKIEDRYHGTIYKCRYNNDMDRPLNLDELYEKNLVKANRTYTIEALIDLIARGHNYPKTDVPVPRYQIPYAEPKRIDSIIPHFTCIYTKTMKSSSGQEYIKYDKEPEDSHDALMAANYSNIARLIWQAEKDKAGAFAIGKFSGQL